MSFDLGTEQGSNFGGQKLFIQEFLESWNINTELCIISIDFLFFLNR